MTVSYKRLWKLLIDKDMKKKDLEKKAGISNYVVSKMNRGENITVDIVGRICRALDCTPKATPLPLHGMILVLKLQ